MSGDIKQFLETQREEILKEKKRLETQLVEENKENSVPNDKNSPIKQVLYHVTV